MGMFIRIQSPIAVTRRGKPISDAKTIGKLDGAESEDECGDHLSAALADSGIEGGKVCLRYDRKFGFRVVTEYTAPKKLSASILKQVIAETRGQWSDGIGEACFDELIDQLGVEIDLCPDKADVTAVQIADPDSKPKKGPSKLALAQAARDGNHEAARAALDAGAEPDARLQKYTPLHLAILYAHPDIALLLIEYGANVKALDPTGLDALVLCGLARELKGGAAAKVARALLDRGVRPNGKRGKSVDMRWTPLSAARSKKPLTNVLLEFGATQ
jgi:hypothetical protein